MSIPSLGAVYGPPGLVPRGPDPRSPEGPATDAPLDPPSRSVSPPSQPLREDPEASAGLPLEAPPGTDPELWSVLTAEERRYFSRAKSLGPVTYSPGRLGLAEMGLQRGGRLDVKV